MIWWCKWCSLCHHIFIHTNPLIKNIDDTLIMNYIQWYHPPIISYSLTFRTINSLDHHPKFLAYLMISPVPVLTVKNFNLKMTWPLLNIYSRIQVLIYQVLRNPQHSHLPPITEKYYLFSIHLPEPWSKYGTYHR